jgi:hypothetical protein
MPSETTTGSRRRVANAAADSPPLGESPAGPDHSSTPTSRSGGYVLPVLNVRLPESAVHAGFWTAVVGAAVTGVVDPPLAVLIGVGVIVSRHRNSS